MNWLTKILLKEGRQRRFRSDDKVRFFKSPRKGTGKGLVLTPSFGRGTVVDYDTEMKRYKVKDNLGEEIDVHPRNLMPDSMSNPTMTQTVSEPIQVEPNLMPA